MNHNKVLAVDLRHYWHSGTGSTSGTHLDALTAKYANGLPFIPGKHLKGVLRHAWHRAEAWGWMDFSCPDGPAEGWETLLFGSRDIPGGRFDSLPGMLFVDDAALGEQEQRWLNAQPALKTHLYQEVFSTAIDEQGSAVNQSLRGIEVAIPVCLFAPISLNITAQNNEHREQQVVAMKQSKLWEALEQCLTLIDSLGASRSRGLGEAFIGLQEQERPQ
jgi:Uncharacterized protein predicted to be involved in DNA repair (RAMP superfamily)